jgi:serine/threonine-protein kinase RsbW
MAGRVRESVTLAGRPERVQVARAFIEGVLGPGHPCGDDAALLASELFGNSLRHSRSALPGGTVTVTVTARAGAIRVEVADRSGPGVPELRAAGADAEGGRGLELVESLASGWGWRQRGGQTVTCSYYRRRTEACCLYTTLPLAYLPWTCRGRGVRHRTPGLPGARLDSRRPAGR